MSFLIIFVLSCCESWMISRVGSLAASVPLSFSASSLSATMSVNRAGARSLPR